MQAPLSNLDRALGYIELNTSIISTLPLRVLTDQHNSGYETAYDFENQEPYFEPATEEVELIMQLTSKLQVLEIPREQLKYVGEV